ncbi:unnamed protein product [Effrenium voratum]|uniref:Acetyl-CoA C-acetyltransferase n=1 Tax=Effrenium voratum TaxID=2562239 RepID=A0AA36JFE5_9DINO|nr:unnamed protein product [Effrenium voratum]
MRSVVLAAAARTPMGSFGGQLSQVPVQRLGGFAMGAALRRAGVEPQEVEMVLMGHALPGACGLNPTKRAAMLAEIPANVDCTSVNKACASGLKAVTLAAQSIAMGEVDVAVAGGMESMSRAPYFLRHARQGGYRYGHGMLEDAALSDGLWDASHDMHLGSCVEHTVQEMGIAREEQDRYAVSSYRRAAEAWKRGAMDAEVAPLRVKNPAQDGLEKRTLIFSVDEEYSRLKLDSARHLPPVFQEEGTITSANASSLNDGAAAVVLLSEDKAREMGVTSLARIVSFADFGVEPLHFAKAPSAAIRKAMQAARMNSVNFYEIHESFAAVVLANMSLLDLDISRVNVNGGAVALGDPMGASGARILTTLLHVLTQQDAETGCAAIANGGGGATAIIIERLQ